MSEEEAALSTTTESAGRGPRTLLIAGTERGLRVAELLVRRDANLVGIVAMQEDDHESARASDAIAALGAECGLVVEKLRRIGPERAAETVAALEPELVIVVGWRTLLPEVLYRYPRLGCVGVHDSPLPRYRGFAPINWAVINGEPRWGVTLFHLSAGVDEGDVIDQVEFAVEERSTARQLYARSTEATVEVIDRQLEALQAGSAPRHPQDGSRATYACARTPDDGEIDWRAPTHLIDRLVRGLGHPYPGAWTVWKGQRLRVHEAEPPTETHSWVGRIPGRVVAFDDRSADVLTGDGVLRLLTVALPGGDLQPAGQVLRSVKAVLGR